MLTIAVCRHCGDDYDPSSDDDDICYRCRIAPVIHEQAVEPQPFTCTACERVYVLGPGESVYCCDGWLWFSDND